MEKSCVIRFDLEGKGIDVTFAGDWIRKDVDLANVAMFRELPKYLNERREKLRKEKEND